MFIKKLMRTQRAPAMDDHICIVRLPDGLITWKGSVGRQGAAVRADGRTKFETIHEAETDAINWARAHGTAHLYIDVSAA